MSDFSTAIHPRSSVEQVEEGSELALRFDERGLIPCITTDYDSGEVLMHGWMNREAVMETLRLGEAVYYSRSRSALWHKGKTSGFIQHVMEFRVDDDQDTVWLRVRVDGGVSCHVGYRSCFYRKLADDVARAEQGQLEFTEHEKVVDPRVVYGDAPNPTTL